ncbi:MAG: hypothetical protein ACI9UN_002880 [Granulosicoccus sp.]|jgi:hypothetical protein
MDARDGSQLTVAAVDSGGIEDLLVDVGLTKVDGNTQVLTAQSWVRMPFIVQKEPPEDTR